MAEEKKEEIKKENPQEEKKEEKPKEEKPKEETEEEPKEEKKKEVKEEEEEEVIVPEKFKDIVEKVEKMTVLDLAELVKILEKKFGVSAAAPVAAAPVQTASNSDQAGAEEGKSEFNIQLTAPGEKKIDVIKVVRDVTGQGLKESKDMVDASANEPQIVKEAVKKEEAEEIKKKFEAAGAKVELK